MPLIGMEKVREVIETIILTAYVKASDPVSLALIASPEHGKTSVALEKDCPSVVVLTDVTGRGIQNLCQMRPEVKHFVLNDLMAVSGKKSHVMQGTISMLAAMTEEGIRGVAYPNGITSFEHGKRGVIVCMTPSMARDQRTWWNKSGFSSRLLPFCYTHSTALTIKINLSIRNGRNDAHWTQKAKEDRREFKVPVSLAVDIAKSYSEYVMQLATRRAEILKEAGYRRHAQYRSMARAHAIYRNWKNRHVTQADIDFLGWMDEFVSYHEPKQI